MSTLFLDGDVHVYGAVVAKLKCLKYVNKKNLNKCCVKYFAPLRNPYESW